MTAYYNENDPFAAAWLRNLIAENLIAPGEVDERSIADVAPGDLRGFTQVHLFAGIGGWAYALQLAGWPIDRPVWTGSCPCQPFSAAGQRKGTSDERHLWPEMFRLVDLQRPPTIFGEQVASADGRKWLCGVRSDLETLAYAVGAADLCAASVGAPHIRQRLYWVANTNQPSQYEWAPGGQQPLCLGNSEHREGLGIAVSIGLEGPEDSGETWQALAAPWAASQFIACPDGVRRIPIEPGLFPLVDGVSSRMDKVRGAGNAIVPQVAASFIRSVS